jgi:hypothetical protein
VRSASLHAVLVLPRGSENAFNRDTILAQSNIYANWQDAQIIVQGRIAKISAQFDF